MTRKLSLAVAMLAIGATLLVVAGFAAAATSSTASSGKQGKTGGTMNINLSDTDFDFLDPALAYADWSWQFTYLMNCKLLNYPDKPAPQGTVLQPEASSMPVISNGGTVYTFTIKSDAGGCKFNTGEKVTAASFAHAINRNLTKELQSPAITFIKDIVGAQDVIDGKAQTAWRCSGTAIGEKLTIRLGGDENIAEVGLIPGYAKTDPESGEDRYAENNRITRARWLFDIGSSFIQQLDGSVGNRSMQTMRIPKTTTGQVTIEILDSVGGPRNTVAISEVQIGKVAQ